MSLVSPAPYKLSSFRDCFLRERPQDVVLQYNPIGIRCLVPGATSTTFHEVCFIEHQHFYRIEHRCMFSINPRTFVTTKLYMTKAYAHAKNYSVIDEVLFVSD